MGIMSNNRVKMWYEKWVRYAYIKTKKLTRFRASCGEGGGRMAAAHRFSGSHILRDGGSIHQSHACMHGSQGASDEDEGGDERGR